MSDEKNLGELYKGIIGLGVGAALILGSGFYVSDVNDYRSNLNTSLKHSSSPVTKFVEEDMGPGYSDPSGELIDIFDEY